MPRVYFEGWYDGVFAKAEDWYKDGVIYVNLIPVEIKLPEINLC